MNRGAIARAALLVAAFTFLSRVLGFLREMILARELGTSAEADVFSTGLLLVNSVAAILAYTMVSVIIPAIERERQDHDEQSGWRLVWTIGSWVVIILVAIAGVVALWPNLVVAPFQLDDGRSALLRDLVQIMAPALALQGITGLLTAVLQAQRRFLGPAAVGVAFNLGIIVALVAFGGSVRAAAWGVVAGAITQVLFQLPQLIGVMRGTGANRPQLRHPRLAMVMASVGPVGAASVLQQINAFSDKYFAGTLPEGQIAALNYSHAAGSLPRTAFLMPLLAPLFPVIARMAAERRQSDTARAFNRAAGVLGLVSLPLGAFLMLYAQETAQLMFGRGKCDITCVTDIAGPLRYLALATWAAFLGYLLNRTLSALNVPKQIFVAAAVSVAVTIIFDIILLGPMGISGLALASTIGVLASLLMSVHQLRTNLPQFSVRRLGAQQSRLILAITIAVAVAWAANRIAPTADRGGADLVVPLLFKSLIGAVTFVAALRILAPDVLREGRAAVTSVVQGRRRG